MTHTTAIFLLLFTGEISTGLSALIGHTYIACQIASPFSSPYIIAYQEQIAKGKGCTTNNTVTGSKQEVHAIYINSNSSGSFRQGHTEIELVLTSQTSQGLDHPLIVVLNSPELIRWRIRLEITSVNPSQHTFVVSRGSGVRFLGKQQLQEPKVEREGGIPQEPQSFLAWVEKKYIVVTSFSQFFQGSKIMLTIGKKVETSKCVIQEDSELSAAATMEIQQEIQGCIVSDQDKSPNSLAYVIEMQQPPEGSNQKVDLEITGPSRRVINKEFKLVLKAPKNVSWNIQTRKVQGNINIVSNGYSIDMTGIRMNTVGYRTEKIDVSGGELVRWVDYYIGPVALYAALSTANKVKLVLPPDDKTKTYPEQTQRPNPVVPVKPSLMKDSLQKVVKTSCTNNKLTVAIDKNILQMFGLKANQISLSKPYCRAIQNATHVILQSESGQCGTKTTGTRLDSVIFSNTVLIHSDIDHLEDAGSGMDPEEITDGSGMNPSDIYVDDEDNNSQLPLGIDIACEANLEGWPYSASINEGMLEMGIYQSQLFLVPVQQYPLSVNINSRVFVEAKIKTDDISSMRAEIQSCWLHSKTRQVLDNHSLIKDRCPSDRSVAWHQVQREHNPRFSFNLEEFVKQTSSKNATLKCNISLCCMDQACRQRKYPMCAPDFSQDCTIERQGSQESYKMPDMVLTLGPIIIHGSAATEPSEASSKCNLQGTVSSKGEDSNRPIVIEGLDSGTVVGIAFAAFIIGVLMMGALWFIHTHSAFGSGPFKRSFQSRDPADTERDYGESTPGSSVPIST
ncbi:hypothetical protein CHS0354_014037 [Potamilus streckersoni]|uniref:ZP domain-containing protein n=1 Tax=Potamilus streckersoni TaxID=2493646 RepID=A0AAE0RUL8_9BIVA|nr:hypothetical protein CHS0354_014037 [Potamilus streckersoni]